MLTLLALSFSLAEARYTSYVPPKPIFTKGEEAIHRKIASRAIEVASGEKITPEKLHFGMSRDTNYPRDDIYNFYVDSGGHSLILERSGKIRSYRFGPQRGFKLPSGEPKPTRELISRAIEAAQKLSGRSYKLRVASLTWTPGKVEAGFFLDARDAKWMAWIRLHSVTGRALGYMASDRNYKPPTMPTGIAGGVSTRN